MRDAMKERMKLQTRCIGAPPEGSQIIDEDVTDVRPTSAPGHRECIHPFRSKTRSILFIEGLSANPVGKAFQRDGAVFKVRQQISGNPDVVIDDVRFGEMVLRVKNLIEIRYRNAAAVDVQLL